ncbi:MAG: hypothetical protein DIZ80_08225 [endosymbiont of Galathealinum brachiosum]|uniref:Thioredoxin domain-containing protein n=1 Tax=endosymbiont of Galathealinum brachiosum TaxID=2200906 RepID=A0A370DGR7_9GAMM|nr:MAG: hypothetical protein DIZ80_08225 [endosymbiont of Galathealinum brachiosum]
MDTFDRLIFVVFTIVVVLQLFSMMRKRQYKTARSNIKNEVSSPVNTPQVIYFWSHQCNQCKTAQKPALNRLHKLLGDSRLMITSVNINENPEKANSWDVKTVPTTYVLDVKGKLRFINNGLTSEHKILEQLQSIQVKI